MRSAAHVLVSCIVLAMWVGPSDARAGVGQEFWFTELQNPPDPPVGLLDVWVVNPGDVSADVEIDDGVTVLASGTVGPHLALQLVLDRRWALVGTDKGAKGLRLRADRPVAAFLFNPNDARDGGSADSTALRPLAEYGIEHRVSTSPSSDDGTGVIRPGLLAVVSMSSVPIAVQVVAEADVAAGFVAATPAGVPIDFVLDPYEAAQLVTSGDAQDLIGSLVRSDAPVAVFAGATCVRLPVDRDECDHLEEQLVPIALWGTEFFGAKSRPRGLESDHWRFIASVPGTRIDIVAGIPITVTLSPGSSFTLVSRNSWSATSDQSIQVVQLLEGQDGGTVTVGGPALLDVTPREDYASHHVLVSPAGFASRELTIVAPDGASVQVDGVGVPPADWLPIGTSGYSSAHPLVAAGLHVVDADVPVAIRSIAHDSETSHGHAAVPVDDVTAPTLTCDAGGPCSVDCGGGRDVARGTAAPAGHRLARGRAPRPTCAQSVASFTSGT